MYEKFATKTKANRKQITNFLSLKLIQELINNNGIDGKGFTYGNGNRYVEQFSAIKRFITLLSMVGLFVIIR